MKRREHGVILLVALVTAMALALAGFSLVRAVSTSVTIGGNLDAHEQAVLAASAAFEHDVAALFVNRAIGTENDDSGHNYFASRQPGEDSRGVPAALQSLAAYPQSFTTVDAGGGFTARHVVERLCVASGEATPAICTLTPPSVEAASGFPPADEPPRRPYYRVTIRVDGTAASAAFVQGIVSEAHANPRLSWRALDDP